MNVTFEPGCRNNWHIHHDCVQVLICVAGRGWYQEAGKEAVKMTPGTVECVGSLHSVFVIDETKNTHGVTIRRKG